jgi:hypothetical protein
MADKLGGDVASVNASRSTCFHEFCATGRWPEETNNLPKQDKEEVFRWKKPGPMVFNHDDVTLKLHYKDAMKELIVAVDSDFNWVEIDPSVPQKKIAEMYPSAMAVGHLDMAWYIPEFKLVVINDIKSSIFAVKSRTESLQLHGYGLALCQKLGGERYITAIWDATEGKHYIAKQSIRLDSWECEEYKERIRTAHRNSFGDTYTTGSGCGGCWKRDICPAHLVDVSDDNRFKEVLAGTATMKEIRKALVDLKQLEDLAKKVKDICKSWAERHGSVLSEDGKKQWGPAMRSGKKSLDTHAVARALEVENLSEYMREGQDYIVFDWRNNK